MQGDDAMKQALAGWMLVAAALLLAAPPATAEVYSVTLKNGGIIQSRQAPQAAGYADDLILVLTEVGNWAALPIDAIASIDSNTEARGFGTILDTTTIVLGWAPNESAEDEDLTPQERMLQLMEQQNQPRPNYSVEQFAEPSETGGIPIWMTGVVTPPMSGVSRRPMSGAQPNSN